MRRVLAALVLLLAPVIAGQTAPLTEPPEGATSLRLACDGRGGAVPSLEFSYLGSCWGHVGHHTYFVGEPRAVVAGQGRVLAVEAELAGIRGDPFLPIEVSMDGRAWTRVGEIAYPTQTSADGDVRHSLRFAFALPAPVPFRFLRVHMPASEQDGLAGFLDHSQLTLQTRATPAEAPTTRAGATLRCEQGVLESFFAAHPCWFGGLDARDRLGRDAPSGAHLAPPERGTSYYGSASFLHTYDVGEVRGPHALRAGLLALPWRPPAHIDACADEGREADPFRIPRPLAIAQASRDGAAWATVALAVGDYGEPIWLAGELPEGTRLVRLGAREDLRAVWTKPACHHPLAFLTDSLVRVGPPA